jgi:lipopolysaccharide transport system ATP-binding protein
VIGYMIKDRLGQPVYGTNTHHLACPMQHLERGEEARLLFHFLAALGPGAYSVAVALHSTEDHLVNNYEWRDLALIFNIVNVSQTTFIGSAWLPPRVEVVRDIPT